MTQVPLGDDEVNHDTDKVLPILSALFGTSNQVIRVIFLDTATEKYFGNGFQLGISGIDSLKSYNLFDRNYLGVSYFHLFRQRRRKCIKLGFCAGALDSVWKQSLKWDNVLRPPKILDQHRKALKMY